MQKLIYTLWGIAPGMIEELASSGATNIILNVARDHPKQMQSVPPLPHAVVSFWLNSAYQRHPAEAVLQAHSSHMSGYVVSQSQPLNAPPPQHWFTQIAFLKKPDGMDRQQWLRIWLDEHTKVAIDTQSTFYYAQNIVARCLTEDTAQQWDAIIEERFPETALSDDHVFFDAKSNAALEANRKAMMQSCARFIDFNQMNVIITDSLFAG